MDVSGSNTTSGIARDPLTGAVRDGLRCLIEWVSAGLSVAGVYSSGSTSVMSRLVCSFPEYRDDAPVDLVTALPSREKRLDCFVLARDELAIDSPSVEWSLWDEVRHSGYFEVILEESVDMGVEGELRSCLALVVRGELFDEGGGIAVVWPPAAAGVVS